MNFRPGAVFLSEFKNPLPITRSVRHVIEIPKYDSIFRNIYRVLTGHSTDVHRAIDLLCEEDFVHMCNYYLMFRLQLVNCSVFGEKREIFVPWGHGKKLLEMPRSVGLIINSIGLISCAQNSYILVPNGDSVPFPSYRQKILNAYCEFVGHLRDADGVPMMALNETPMGAAYWALRLKSVDGGGDNGECVVVSASFPEWTGKDALLAAIVNLAPESNVIGEEDRFESPILRNIGQIRKTFFHTGYL